jgi:Lon protease-like protein
LLLFNLFAAGKQRETVPLFPLGTVLFPGALLPLKIFEVRYMDMAKRCVKDKSPFGICLIREGVEVGVPAVPETVGCFASIAEFDVDEVGILKVVAHGEERFRIVATETTSQGLVMGEVEALQPEPKAPDVEGLRECSEFLAKVITGIGVKRFAEPLRFEDASWVGFRLAEILPLRNDVKQKLLELTDATLRLAVLHRFLRQQKLLA